MVFYKKWNLQNLIEKRFQNFTVLYTKQTFCRKFEIEKLNCYKLNWATYGCAYCTHGKSQVRIFIIIIITIIIIIIIPIYSNRLNEIF